MNYSSRYPNKKVVLEGCNGEWAQKHYLPFLIEKAMIRDITLWAVDIQPDIKPSSTDSHSLWRIAEGKGRAHYLNADKGRESLGVPRNVDYVFIVTPDRCHCEVAEFWLSRLGIEGKIFIEKPLDASIQAAEQLKANIPNNNAVYGFDHYLVSFYPFLRRVRQYLAKIGDIKSLEINILENDAIPPHQVQTLKEGVIFDLFPHVLAVSVTVIEEKLAPTEDILQKAKFVDGARAKYNGWPFSSETYARIKLTVSDKELTSMVGKGIGETPDKQMIIHGTHRGKIEIDFQDDSFSMNGEPKRNLESKPVEFFLEAVLAGSSIDSVPGVLSFGAAFAILERLSDIRGNINMGPDYDIGTFPP